MLSVCMRIYIYQKTSRHHLLILNLVSIEISHTRIMPSYTMLNVKMQRESNSTPWGFRMQGKDFFSRGRR